MSKLCKTLLASALVFSTGTTVQNIHAKEALEPTGVYLQLGFSRFNLDSVRDIETPETIHYGLGYQFSEHWAAEFRYSEKETHIESPTVGPNFDFTNYSLSALYRVFPRNENTFFWKLGLVENEVAGRNIVGPSNTTKTSTGYLVGLGIETQLSTRSSLVFGLDTFHESATTDFNPYIALNIFFGKKAQSTPIEVKQPAPSAPAPSEPNDSDNDGVADDLDQCPNTPSGVSVGSDGCPLDDDNDGVPNHLDQCPNTPAGAKVDASGCREMLTEDVSIVMNVQFANNSNEVTDTYHSEIKRVADFMQQYPDTTVVIEGHTDSRGAASYNQQLSEKRANGVMQYLVNNFGIDSNRVTAVGRGEESPVANNETADGRKQNRRVQAEIKATVKKPQ